MSDLGAQLFSADLGRILHGEPDDSDPGATLLDNADTSSTATTGASALERQYFSLARDMNEVLVSPLHDAAARDNVEALRIAVPESADGVNTRDNAGNTPAHWAAGAGACAALAYLLELEADVTLKNSLGDTPLHRAVWRGQFAAVRLLVDRGRIDIGIRNNDQMLAVDLARDARIRALLSSLSPLDSVPSIMHANEEDFENSDDDDGGDDGDDEQLDELERAKREGFVFDGRHDDDDDDDGDGDDDDDDDVDAIILVGDTGDRVQILHVGVREAVGEIGPPPPVPPRHGRPSLSNVPIPSTVGDDDDELPPLEPFDQPSKFEDAD
jgi:hypothetical protein